jgi:hypothetical protein
VGCWCRPPASSETLCRIKDKKSNVVVRLLDDENRSLYGTILAAEFWYYGKYEFKFINARTERICIKKRYFSYAGEIRSGCRALRAVIRLPEGGSRRHNQCHGQKEASPDFHAAPRRIRRMRRDS